MQPRNRQWRPVDVAAGIALLIWWAPTLAVGIALVVPHLAALAGTPYRIRRVGRLIDCGRVDEADRVIAALQRECDAARRRWRGSVGP